MTLVSWSIKYGRLALIGSSLTLASCASFTPTKRYNNSEKPTLDATTRFLSTSYHSIPVPKKSQPKTVFDLAPEGQQAYIEALNARTGTTAPELISSLSKPITTGAKPRTDYRTFSRRLILTVDHVQLSNQHLGDRPDLSSRLENMRVDIVADHTQLGFTGWSALSNDRKVIDIADLVDTTTQENNATAGLDTLSPDLASLSLSGTATRQLAETIRVRADQIKLYGGISTRTDTGAGEARAFIVESGAPLTSVGGFRSLDVTVKLKDFKREQAVVAYSGDASAGKAVLSLKEVQVPNNPTICGNAMVDLGIAAELQVEAFFRTVGKGHKTWIEADDAVTYLQATNGRVDKDKSGKVKTVYPNVELIPAADVRARFVRLEGPRKHPLIIVPTSESPGQGTPIASYEMALKLLNDGANNAGFSITGYDMSAGGSSVDQTWFKNAKIVTDRLSCGY